MISFADWKGQTCERPLKPLLSSYCWHFAQLLRLPDQLPFQPCGVALADFDRIWGELFPVEQARLVRLLVERVDVSDDGIKVRLRTDGLRDVIGELQVPSALDQAA